MTGSLLLFAVQGDLSQVGIVFVQFQLALCVLLVLCSDDKVLVVLSADKPDNLSLFAFLLCHESLTQHRRCDAGG